MSVLILGEYKFDVQFMGLPIRGSPFTVNAWDAHKVLVNVIGPGYVAKPSYFKSKRTNLWTN